MTTIAQVRRLLAPLLERHDDLTLIGRWLHVRPVSHFVRGVLIDRMTDSDLVVPRWAVAHLFEPRRFIPLGWGDFIGDAKPERWRMSDPSMPEAFGRTVEDVALPVLRGVNTFENYLSLVSVSRFRHQLFEWPQARIVVEVAIGDLEAARKTAALHLDTWSRADTDRDPDARARYRRLSELGDLLAANDRPALAAKLHQWEAMSIANLKLHAIWQRQPLPCETGANLTLAAFATSA
jgi:hypothetical protein